jgi:hypothetical protein
MIPTTIATIHPIAIPAMAPIGMLIPFCCPSGKAVTIGFAELEVELSVDDALLVTVTGIGPFAGFVSVAYRYHEGFRKVVRR